MKDWLKRLTERPWIAHLLRANERFSTRLGNQFGAAITYFSVLALVPIAMFAFGITGFVLINSRPELIIEVKDYLADVIGSTDPAAKDKLGNLIDQALHSYASIGIIGLVSGMYAGAGWAGNIKEAVRAQWRPVFDLKVKKQNFAVKFATNLALLLALLIAVALTFAVASAATALRDEIMNRFGLVGGIEWALRLVPIAVSIATGWLFFMFLYRVLAETRVGTQALRRGALIGAIGLALLQYLTSFLFSIFTGSPAAAIFGPVIALMLFFNLFARLILFIAAWIATSEQDAIDPELLARRDGTAAIEEPAASDAEPEDTLIPDDLVPQHVAVRSVRVGMGAGYITGAATGVGLGALIAAAAAAVSRPKSPPTRH